MTDDENLENKIAKLEKSACNQDFYFLKSFFLFFFKILFIYSWETQRERQTQAEEEAGFMQGAWCGTWSWDSRITPWAEGRWQTAEPPRDPQKDILKIG